MGSFNYGEWYEILKCQNCDKVELRVHSYHQGFSEEEVPTVYKTLYPEPIIIPDGLPRKVKAEYERAIKARHGDSNGYGVLLGRVLESVFHDKKAKGKMLGQQLQDMAARKMLPPETLAFADKLNKLRVVGAHFSVGKLTPKDIPIMEKLTKVILEYVYSAPFIMKQAEKAVKKVNGEKKTSRKVFKVGNVTVQPADSLHIVPTIGNSTVQPIGSMPNWRRRMRKSLGGKNIIIGEKK